MTTPTKNEIEMADYRAKVAAEEEARLAKVMAVLGPGADAYAEWVLTDRTGQIAEQRIPTGRRHGQGWQPPAPTSPERLTNEEGTRLSFVDAASVRHFPFRFIVWFHSFSHYKPQTAEQLAAAREKREAKARAAQAEEMALFPGLTSFGGKSP